MSDLCRKFGISRKTGYRIFNGYKEHGLEALCDRSRRPVRYANQMPEPIERMIVDCKREKPHWGARYDTVISGVPLIGDSAVFIGYRRTYFDNGCCVVDTSRFTEHTIMAGFSYHFGGQTLLDFDRVGATLDLPTFGRWVAGGEQID